MKMTLDGLNSFKQYSTLTSYKSLESILCLILFYFPISCWCVVLYLLECLQFKKDN